jgi:hypothetical protein
VFLWQAAVAALRRLLSTRDGTLWIGTFAGLASWNGSKLTRRAELNGQVVGSLIEDREGTVWAGSWQGGPPSGRLCAIGSGGSQCYGEDGAFGKAVSSLYEDRSGNLWAGTASGLWRWKPGPPKRYATPPMELTGVTESGDGRLVIAEYGAGLLQFAGDKVGSYAIRGPGDNIHWTIEDDDRCLWLYTGCGLIRVARTELDAWIADPKRRIETTVWDAPDGVRLRSTAVSRFGPRVAKSTDDKLWFVTGEGVQVVDPRHLAVNRLPPPVHIEQIKADGKLYQLKPGMHFLANVRDVWIDYTALSLVAPEKVHFKYKLEGQDQDWQEVINDRQAQYTNLPPRHYRFRVIACSNSGVWNETGDALEFSIDPAFLPNKCISLRLRGLFSSLDVDGLSDPCPAHAAGLQHASGRADAYRSPVTRYLVADGSGIYAAAPGSQRDDVAGGSKE